MRKLFAIAGMAAAVLFATAQNPLIHNQFTADPTARVFNGRVYLYPSHDIHSPIERLQDWFCMADYHVFSSDNLTDWTDHGVIVTQNAVPWVQPDSYAMWAPDCIEKDGKYYFFFPAAPQGGRGFGIGIAEADSPEGPFTPREQQIKGVFGIDPSVLIDDDGQVYLYWQGGGLHAARLNDNMTALAEKPVRLQGLPQGFMEGPFAFKKDGKYYLSFPWVRTPGGTEALAYAMSDSPMGPFDFKGLIMEESPTGCWTNHHSLIDWDGQWYLFYHHNDYSPEFDKNRSARCDSLNFNADGTIQLVKPTLRGAGVADAAKPVHIDRYSTIGGGTSIAFIDRTDKFQGWKTLFERKGAWVRFDKVKNPGNVLTVKGRAARPATIKVSVDSINGPVVGIVDLPLSDQMVEVSVPATPFDGVRDLFVTLTNDGYAEVDWLTIATPGADLPAGADGSYFTPGKGALQVPFQLGQFIRRWDILEPIDKPNRSNTVFTDSYLHDAFYHEYFKDQFTIVPKDGQTVKIDGKKLRWHDVESTGYNVQLYRFATTQQLQKYGVLFWVVTVIDCPEDVEGVRLSVGSNSASMWWLDGQEVLMLSGDRRMVVDDAMSAPLTLAKGRHVLRGAVINGPGMSSFCARFVK